MIGKLPDALIVTGKEYPIQTDYRNILMIFAAISDPDLSVEEKLYILLKRLFGRQLESIGPDDQEEALKQAKWFIDCGREDDEKKVSVKLIDWEQDESMIFPAINKIAGTEIRSAPFIHWWTFMGYFMEIEEGTFSTVLSIRQKRSRGKKLEKWEQEFYRNNKALCDLKKRYSAEELAEREYWNKVLG